MIPSNRGSPAGGAVEELEEVRERYFWGTVLRVIWTSVAVLLVLGPLASLTVVFGWWKQLLLCLLGLIAGTALVVASGSRRGRELTAVVLGAVTLPLLATRLAAAAAEGEVAFGAHSASLFPFLAHATGAAVGAIAISRIWRGRPVPPPSEERAGTPDALRVAAPARADQIQAKSGGR
jgi:hypothetical protein